MYVCIHTHTRINWCTCVCSSHKAIYTHIVCVQNDVIVLKLSMNISLSKIMNKFINVKDVVTTINENNIMICILSCKNSERINEVFNS